MRIVINPVLDMETLEWVGNDGVYSYDGPVTLAKGAAAKQDLANQKTASNWASPLMQQAQSEQQTLLPFFNQELLNPQGFNPQTLGEMTTASGQSTSSALGNAAQQARLNAARTGNMASLPGVIDEAARSAMKTGSNNALDINLKNQELKNAQQQAGVSGLNGLSNEDIQAALNSLNAASGASQAWGSANQSAWGPFNSIFGDLTAGLSSVASAGKL